MLVRLVFAALLSWVALGAHVVHARETLDRVVAVVNDEIVLLSELRRQTQQSVLWQEALAQLGDATPQQIEAKRKEVRAKVLDELIDNLLVRKEAERFQIQVTDEQVDKYLQELAAQNGFSGTEELKAQVEQSGAYGTWEKYKQDIRRQLLIYNAVNMLAAPTVTEAQIRAYYRKMTKDEGATVDVDRFVVVPSGSDSKARDQAFAEAQTIGRKLRAGVDPQEIAEAIDYQHDPRLTIARGAVAPAVEDAVFAAKEGQVVGPLASGQGYEVMRIVEHHASAALSYEQAKPKIQQHLWMEASVKAEKEFKRSLRAKAHVDIRL